MPKVIETSIPLTKPKQPLKAGSFVWIMLGALQFIVLTVLAMYFYPGTTIRSNATEGYLFAQNFFSDLGRTVTYAGVPKWESAILFVVGLVLGAVSLGCYFLLITQLFRPNRWAHLLSWLSAIGGVITAILFVGIGLVPSNWNQPVHEQLVYLAFITMTITVAIITIAHFIYPPFARIYTVVNHFFLLALASYVLLLFFGPNITTDTGLKIQVIGQKIIAYTSILALLLQSFGAWRAIRN